MPKLDDQMTTHKVASAHDVGGRGTSGTVPRKQHAFAPWELRVDAMMQLLTDPSRPGGQVMTVDELRRGVESLEPEDYRSLSYYQRWLRSILAIMIERGHVEEAALEAKLAELGAAE
jgi:hypothetical protein